MEKIKKGMKMKRKMGRKEILYSDMCYLLAISHANFSMNSCASLTENNSVYHWPRFIVGLYKILILFDMLKAATLLIISCQLNQV